MADFTCFIQFCLMLPFMYLAPKMHKVMPDVAVSLFSVNWAIWFTFGMISAEGGSNVDYRHRRDIVHGRIHRSLNARERDLSASGTRLGAIHYYVAAS